MEPHHGCHRDSLREQDSRELETGFAAIIDDFLTTALDGCTPDPEFYELLIEQRRGQRAGCVELATGHDLHSG